MLYSGPLFETTVTEEAAATPTIIIEKIVTNIENQSNQNKMISEEDRETGFVKLSVYNEYFKYNGGFLIGACIILSNIKIYII